jgi:hypothetical protein
MRKTARPWRGEPGNVLTEPCNSGYKRPSTPPQRLSRRRPNRPFCDEVPAPSELGGLTVDLAGGSCRALEAVIGGGDYDG